MKFADTTDCAYCGDEIEEGIEDIYCSQCRKLFDYEPDREIARND